MVGIFIIEIGAALGKLEHHLGCIAFRNMAVLLEILLEVAK